MSLSSAPTTPAVAAPKKTPLWLYLGFVVILSYLTFFHRYWEPHYVFWDENYHIASAQKYLHGVYFMEQHPPLGKLLIAAGETLLSPNERTDQFLGTDYGTDFAEGFSFAGYRFFSALLSWLAAPLIFLCLYVLTRKNALAATLLSFLYIFDTALIVHSRGAMLEGPMMFFAALQVLAFLLLWEQPASKKHFLWLSVLFGAAFGLMLTTKVLGLIFILLVPVLLWGMRKNRDRIPVFLLSSFLAFLAVYCSVWYIHFASGKTVNPVLPDSGFYQASEQYKRVLAAGKTDNLLYFPIMLRDSLKFVGHYNGGAPRLDLCKADENGSPWWFWPFGGRSINYRWETPDGGAYRYLYLQANPVIWWTVLASVMLGIAMLLSTVLFPPKRPLQRPLLLAVFLGLYVSYMAAVSQIDRVMYLYHYFLPLFFGFFIVALVWQELQTLGNRPLSENARITGLMGFAGLAFLAFLFYRPLAYYQPMTDEQVSARAIFPLWELHCVKCEKVSPLVIPSK